MSATHPLKIEINVKNKAVLIKHTLAQKNAVNQGIVAQMEGLTKGYTSMGKVLVLNTDEFMQKAVYKIPLLTPHD